MSQRQLRLIFGILAVLVIGYLLPRLGKSGREPVGPDIGAAVDTTVGLIRIIGADPADSVHLERSGAGWIVNGYPADTALVHAAIRALDTASVEQLVARSPSNHERLGVTEQQAKRVSIGPADAPAIEFLLGGSGRLGRFIRLPDTPEVYAVAAEAVRPLERNVNGWRDRLIAEVDTASVIAMRIRRGRDELLLTRVRSDSASHWAADGIEADSARVGRVLSTVAELRASGFPSDSTALAADFDHPAATLELYDADPGKAGTAPTLSLLFSEVEGEPAYLVRRADRPLMYRLSEWTARQLLPTREELSGS